MSNNPTTAAATAAASPPNNPPNADAGAAEATPHDNNFFIAADDIINDGASVSNQSLASSTTSLSESIYDFRVEHGRTYHGYKDGKYASPNDEQENDRLDLQHHLFIRTFDGRLGNAPPTNKGAKVGRVLDVGTGTGIWAIDFGEEHPEADVLGVDLSPPAAAFVPGNVRFEVDDIEEPWNFSRPFDYIHSRMMTGGIYKWEKYIENCFRNLVPGGYLELNEGDIIPLSDDGTLEGTSLLRALSLWAEGLAILGHPFEDITRLEGVMRDVGFEDVQLKRFKWPSNSWPRDPKYKELGYWNYENLSPNWEGFLMAPLTRALEWTKEEVLVLAMEARKDCGDRNIHAYFQMYSIYGRKPLKTEADEPAAPTATGA
ncbi:methyltransferase domain-containing protein [Colletotrichum falcatum]|nr:methyltransferase domain-containing protein [Colletotrichum falcatum]